MNDADKPKLKEALEKLVGKPYDKTPDNSKYVLDGDSLLYKVQWSVGQTFKQICDNYKSYIRKRYGQKIDGGYNVVSTKDSTHIRRAKGRVGKKVQLSLGNQLTMKKSDFLLNNSNKQDFIFVLGAELVTSVMDVLHSDGDMGDSKGLRNCKGSHYCDYRRYRPPGTCFIPFQ